MSPVESITSVFKNYVNFMGRARRSEYWWFALAYGLLFHGLLLTLDPDAYSFTAEDGQFSGGLQTDNPVITLIALAVLLPSLAVAVRRLHDTGRSGLRLLWAITIVMIPVIIIWLALDSKPGENKYGPNPKGE